MFGVLRESLRPLFLDKSPTKWLLVGLFCTVEACSVQAGVLLNYFGVNTAMNFRLIFIHDVYVGRSKRHANYIFATRTLDLHSVGHRFTSVEQKMSANRAF
jgi:hypothetical protein